MTRRSGGCFVAVLVAASILVAWSWSRREHTYATAEGPDGYVARLAWHRSFLVSFSSVLSIVDSTGRSRSRRALLENRDTSDELMTEIPSVRWQGEQVVLSLERHWYTGPETLSVLDQAPRPVAKRHATH